MGYMREILNIALVLAVAGFFVVTVMALSFALSKTVTRTETVTNNEIYRGMTGLKVSLPHDMKNLPVELVPLPRLSALQKSRNLRGHSHKADIAYLLVFNRANVLVRLS